MIKRSFIVFITLLLLLSCAVCATACGNKADPAEDNGDKTEIGTYTVKYQGTVIELGKDATGVLTALGEPSAKQFVASCGEGAGDQWRYTYASIYLFTVKTDEGEIVDAVALRDDIAKTGKGITVGSTEAEITAAYGEPTAKQGNKLRYTKDNHTMEFVLDDADMVKLVEIRVEG